MSGADGNESRAEWEVLDRISMLGDCMSALAGMLIPSDDLDMIDRGKFSTLMDWIASQHRAALDEYEAIRARKRGLKV